jgi:hypothetical protein
MLGDMNSCVGAMHVNLSHIWGAFENIDSIIIIVEVGQIKYALLKERNKNGKKVKLSLCLIKQTPHHEKTGEWRYSFPSLYLGIRWR